ncbi:MAG: hypothetical protein SGBAC_012977, partial [Bacillariaceae sp.]
MPKDSKIHSQSDKSQRKRSIEAAFLDDSNPSKRNVSDKGDDSDATGRNDDYNAKTNKNDNNNGKGSTENDRIDNSISERRSETQDVKLSASSSQAGNAKLSANGNKNKEQSELHDEEEQSEKHFLDPKSPLPQKRRKKPSQKIRMLQEVDEEELDGETKETSLESRSKQRSRRPAKRKITEHNGTIRYKKARLKKFDPDEEQVVLDRARQKGLPKGWTVAFHMDWNRKVWISPDESRICDTVPRAISISKKFGMGVNNDDAEMDGEENDTNCDADDDDKGSDTEEGTRVAGSFVWLKKASGKTGNDPASLLIARSIEIHELSETQERAALKKGRDKGLREDGWRCVWNSRFRRKNWISPQGRQFGNLSRAVEKQDDWLIKEEKKQMKQNKRKQELEEEWQKQYNRLRKYKRRHGDTLIPDNSERYSELRCWVRRQRREYYRSIKTDRSNITPEQIEALNKLGFQWEIVKVPKR